MNKAFSQKFLTSASFNEFTYSKNKHFNAFFSNDYDEELFGKAVNPSYCDLKVYQDLLVFSFIKQNILAGSKILEVGGGNSRILKYFQEDYECWNIDKLEAAGHGLIEIDTTGFRLISDYMGNFNEELPEGYFDLVFSISTLQHIPHGDIKIYNNILKDINRVLKPEGYSIHCVEHETNQLLKNEKKVWVNPIISFFFDNQKMINDFIPLEIAKKIRNYFLCRKNSIKIIGSRQLVKPSKNSENPSRIISFGRSRRINFEKICKHF